MSFRRERLVWYTTGSPMAFPSMPATFPLEYFVLRLGPIVSLGLDEPSLADMVCGNVVTLGIRSVKFSVRDSAFPIVNMTWRKICALEQMFGVLTSILICELRRI
jgi:hypothetical protein